MYITERDITINIAQTFSRNPSKKPNEETKSHVVQKYNFEKLSIQNLNEL